ncbi:MAG: S9 family peptidase [Bacteroidales bacterium]|nr:S9 family peptidase [Bacteroidales bacterium]
MKKYIALPLAVTVIAGCGIDIHADSIRISDFRASKPVSILKPAIGDSAALKNFTPASLLKYNWNGDFTTVAQGTSAPDTTGFLRLPETKEGMDIHGIRTHLIAARYTKGALKITSALPFEVFADGKSLGKKETYEDSISANSTKSLSLDLQPQNVTEIMVKLISDASGKATPDVKVEYVPEEKFKDVLVESAADMKKRFSIVTTVEGKRATGSSLSPDGKYLLTFYQETFDGKNMQRWATLSETATGKVINADIDISARWMTSTDELISVRKNDGAFDVYLIEVPSMKQRLLASKVPVSTFDVAPDGSYLIYEEYEEGTAENGPMKRILSPDDRIPGNRGRSYLMKYDLKKGISQPLTLAGPSTSLTDISHDSRKILYVTVRETPSQWPFYANSLIEMDVNTLRTDTIVKDDSFITSGIFSPDGKQVFAWGGPSAFDMVGANQGDHPIPNDFDVQGFIVNIADRKVKPVTRDFAPSLSGTPVWNRADGCIYFLANDRFYQPIYRYNPAKDKFTRFETGLDKVLNFSIGYAEDKWLTYTGQGYDDAGAIYRLDLSNGKSVALDKPMTDVLEQINFGKVENRPFRASDGTMIDANIILPPDFDASRKYPMIVYYYGGTMPSDRSMNSPYTPHLFASRDYVVYVINPSGAVGYGQEFSARHVNAWGKRTSEDIIEGVKQLCKTDSYIDADHIGCIGASYGGFMTQYLLTQTDIFAAAVSHAGISNITSYWGEGYWGYTYNSVAAAKSYPWSNPELFTKQGSLFNADKIHTPLLLLHGTVDTNVPIGESIQLFNALKILGRDVEMITVEDQNHIILDYDKRVVWHATIMAWFAKWLQGDSRWWDALYGE